MTLQFLTTTFFELVIANDIGLISQPVFIVVKKEKEDIPTIFIALILGPFVPYLSIPVDTAFIIPIKDIILAFDNPS